MIRFRVSILSFALMLAAVFGIAAQDATAPDRLDDVLAKTRSEDSDERVDAFLQFPGFADQPDKLLIPLVKAMVASDTRAEEAAEIAAAELSDAIVPYCDSLLESDDIQQVLAAAQMIHRLGSVAISTTPKLVALAKSDDTQRRLAGLFGLVNLPNSDPAVIDALEPFLDDEDFRRQVLACRAIVTIGPPAARFRNKLRQLVDNGNLSTRSHALTALGALGPTDEFDVVALLTRHLQAPLQPDRDRALIGLMYLGPAASSAQAEVERLMTDPEKSVPCQAALTLWKITGDPKPSLDALVKFTQEFDLDYEALDAIYQMKEAAVGAVETVAGHLRNEDGSVRSLAIKILENLGAAAKPYLGQLEERLQQDEDPVVRYHARRLVCKLKTGG
jgi:molybdopterin synthase catalytic subunit